MLVASIEYLSFSLKSKISLRERFFGSAGFFACSLYLSRIKFIGVVLFINDFFDLSSFARFVFAEEKRIVRRKRKRKLRSFYFIFIAVCKQQNVMLVNCENGQ